MGNACEAANDLVAQLRPDLVLDATTGEPLVDWPARASQASIVEAARLYGGRGSVQGVDRVHRCRRLVYRPSRPQGPRTFGTGRIPAVGRGVSSYERGVEIAEKIQTTGLHATVDPRSVTPPCVLVTPPGRTYDLSCGYTARWSLIVLAPGTGNADSVQGPRRHGRHHLGGGRHRHRRPHQLHHLPRQSIPPVLSGRI